MPNVITVIEAIAFAHSERVIHRDLKPANILVGSYGETVVIDWGLAKDLADASDADVEDAGTSPYRASADATAIGKVMGTPAYMPLEQARGQSLDERADVYALGAILHHVLTGRPPYHQSGETSIPWESLLARVLSGPPPPLAGAAELPADLVTIVERAMARDPEDRYPSAGELAQDLRRFQTGQLVGAHRYSTWHLVRRWAKRHRGVLAVAAAAVVVIGVLSVIGVRRILAERDRAEDNAAKAENLVDFMMTDLQPRLDEIGKLALFDVVADRVVRYYEEGDITSDDQRRRYGSAVQSQGFVASERGELDKARRELERAVQILAPLAAADPQDAPLNTSYYRTRNTLIMMRNRRGDSEGAIQDYVAMRAELLALPGPPAWADKVVAMTFYNTGVVYQERGDHVRAADAYASAIERHRAGLKQHPEDNQRRDSLGDSLNRHAFVAMRRGDVKLAEAEVAESEQIFAELIASSPKNTSYLSSLGSAAFRHGELAQSRKDATAALAAFEVARVRFEEIMKLDPSSLANLDRLAGTYSKISDAYDDLKDKPHRQEAVRKYIEIAELAARSEPSNDNFQRGVTLAYMRLATVMRDEHKPKEALAELQRVLDKNVTRAAATKTATIHSDNSYVYQQIGQILTELEDMTGAKQALERSIEEVKTALVAQPGNLEWVHDLFVRRYVLKQFYEATNRPADAIATLRVAAKEYDTAMPRGAQIDYRSDGAAAWAILARLESKARNHVQALADIEHAVALRDAILADHPKEKSAIDERDEIQGTVAEVLAAAGRRAEARAIMTAVLAKVDARRSPAVAEELKKSRAACCR
ncbi:MAG: protein kinase [Kofleriaceae bacterium]